jgi:hypothetical protein
MGNREYKIRDQRKKEWFWIDNEYLNGYGKFFGAIGVAIYVSLCRYANNKTQQCFPAQKRIAEDLNISDRAVRKYLKLFEQYRIICVEREKDKNTMRWKNNVYVLLDKSNWIRPEELRSAGEPEEPKSSIQRNLVPHNNTNINNTNNIYAAEPLDGKELKESENPRELKQYKPHKQFIDFWYETCQRTRGVKPIITGRDAKNFKRVIDAGILSIEQIEQIATYFLAHPIFRKFSPSIATFLSAGILNGLMNQMKNNPNFWKEIDDFSVRYIKQPKEKVIPSDLAQKLNQLKAKLAMIKI